MAKTLYAYSFVWGGGGESTFSLCLLIEETNHSPCLHGGEADFSLYLLGGELNLSWYFRRWPRLFSPPQDSPPPRLINCQSLFLSRHLASRCKANSCAFKRFISQKLLDWKGPAEFVADPSLCWEEGTNSLLKLRLDTSRLFLLTPNCILLFP